MSLSKLANQQLIKSSQPWLRLAITVDDPIRICLLCVLHRDGEFLVETYNALPRNPQALYMKLNELYVKDLLAKLKRKKIIKQDQWNLLYPSTNETDSTKFDVTLIVVLIKNFNNLPKTKNGKLDHALLHSSDNTILANVIRALYTRNQIYHCGCATSLKKSEIDQWWSEIKFIAKGLRYQGNISDYETMSLDPDSVQLFTKFQARMQYQIDLLHDKQNDLSKDIGMQNDITENLDTEVNTKINNLDAEVNRKINLLEKKLITFDEIITTYKLEGRRESTSQLCEIIQSSEETTVDIYDKKLQELDKVVNELQLSTPEVPRKDVKVTPGCNQSVIPKLRLNSNDTVDSVTEDILLTCRSDFKEYSTCGNHEVFSVISLKAPFDKTCRNNEDKRAPVNLVAVIDKSGSMRGLKLKLVKKTLRYVITQLNSGDKLSIITYDTDVYVDFELQKMNYVNKELASSRINQIEWGSRTNLCGGLLKGMCELIYHIEGMNEVASVLLFTDGIANEGICLTQGIIQAMKDPKRFDGPTFNSSNTPTDSARTQISSSVLDQISIYTFGFGEDHVPDMLREISDAGNGMYYYIEHEDTIAESFSSCVGGLMSTVAQGIQMQVIMSEGVTIKIVETGRPYNITNDNKCVKINIGDLQSEENRDIVLQLEIKELKNNEESVNQPLYNVTVDYYNVITNNLQNTNESLQITRTPKELTHHKSEVDVHVDEQVTRVEVTQIIKRASLQADEGNMEGARHLISNELAILEKKLSLSRYSSNNEDLSEDSDNSDDECGDVCNRTRSLYNDLVELSKHLVDQDMWNKKGKKSHVNIYFEEHVQMAASDYIIIMVRFVIRTMRTVRAVLLTLALDKFLNQLFILQQHIAQRNSRTRSHSYITRSRIESKIMVENYLTEEMHSLSEPALYSN